jgi:carbonic anhydrase/acetyltransferase-like protein (isoleucine patch superfamily)
MAHQALSVIEPEAIAGRQPARGAERPARIMNSQPASGSATGAPSFATLGQHRPEAAGAASVASAPCSSDASPSAPRRASGTGQYFAPTVIPSSSANAATYKTAASCTQIPACRVSLGSDVTVGHNATLHGCAVEDQVLIDMGAILLNGTHVGRHSVIAAGTVLVEGQQIPGDVLVAGVPGKVRRELSQAERTAIQRNAASYVELALLHRRGSNNSSCNRQ